MSMCLRGSNQEQINLDHCSWLVTIIRTAHTYIYKHTHRHACTNMIHNITYIYLLQYLAFACYLQHVRYTASHLYAIYSIWEAQPAICTLFASTLYTPHSNPHFTLYIYMRHSTIHFLHAPHFALHTFPPSTVYSAVVR
jgi:hypothetical protein